MRARRSRTVDSTPWGRFAWTRGAIALAAMLALLGMASPARAQDSVLVQVGGELAAPIFQYLDVPITVDMRGAPGRRLGSYTARVTWPQAELSFSGVLSGSFAFPSYNTDSAYSAGVLRLIAAQPAGADSVITLFTLRFYVYADTAPGTIAIEITEMTAATTFEDLLPLVRIQNGTFCRALGRWGDVDADQQVGSRDALVALSAVVGLPIDPLFDPSLADVDGDGRVTSRDALIILSYAVGLDVAGFRLGLTASACGTATGLTLRLRPDSLELQSGQQAQFIVEGFDAQGRPISTADVQFSTSNSNVAGVEFGYIVGRDPGVATITATLGPGITASMEVTVLARRRVWYVDVLNADPVIQTGSLRHPFAFIGDALYSYEGRARDGDTVMVAPGTYEEVVSEDVSVTLLGDAVDRPVIDARGAPYFSGGTVLYLGTRAAPVEIRNFVIRGGGIYADGASLLVRNVDIEAPVYTTTALEFYGEPILLPGAPQGAARTPPAEDLGNVVIDTVTVSGSFDTGIEIYQADSVFINNVTISRDTVGGSCTAYRYGSGAIMVEYAWWAEVRDNVIDKARCTGIGVFVERSRAIISRNRVNGVAGTGILASAPVIALDHNVVRDVAADYFYYEREGVRIDNDYGVDSVVSVGDSIVNVVSYYPYGIRVDTAGTAVVDSLVLDGVGQDSSFYGIGVQFQWAKSSLTNSRILNNKSDVAVASCGTGGVLRSRGNFISGSRGPQIAAYDCLYYYTGVPDSLFSTRDTVQSPLTAEPGVYAQTGVDYVQVDSAVFQGASLPGAVGGVHVDAVGRLVVRDSRIREWYYGIYASAAAEAEISRDSLVADSVGIDLNGVLDTVPIFGVTIDSSRYDGILLVNGSVALLDSSLVSNSGQHGLVFHVSSSARVTRTRFQSNAVYGVLIDSDGGIVSPSVAQSTLSGNGVGGAASLAFGATLDADSNYWGDPLGPRCDSVVTGVACSPASTGDSVTTANVTFTPFLSSPPVTPAPPPPVMAMARSVTASSALRRPTLRPMGSPPASTYRLSAPSRQPEFSPPPTGPRGPRPQPPSWQKGRQPRAPRQPAN